MNITKLVTWFCETYAAKSLINGTAETKQWRDGAFDALVQVLMQDQCWDKNQTETWLVEEINARINA